MKTKTISDANEREENQLDPFVLSSETNGRFLLLIFSAFLLVWYLSSFLTNFTGYRLDYNQDMEAMWQAFHVTAEATGEGGSILELSDTEISNLASELGALQKQAFFSGLYRVAIPFLSVAAFFSLAIFIYRTHPILLHRRHQTKQLDTESDHSILSYVQCVIQALNIPYPIKIVTKPSISYIPPNALTFGLRRQNTIMLYGKSENIEKEWQRYPIMKNFRQSVILHELGHIVNKDMTRYYLAGAIWIAFVIFSILFLVSFLAIISLTPNNPSIETNGAIGQLNPRSIVVFFQMIFTLICIYFIFKGIVRIREFYADWQAAKWGKREALVNYLALTNKKKSWFTRFKETHPSQQQRNASLEDPTKSLFRISIDLPILTGFLLAIMGVGMTFLVILVYFTFSQAKEVLIWNLVQQLELSLPSGRTLFTLLMFLRPLLDSVPLFLIILPVPYLVVRTLGIQVQRDLIADLNNQSNHFGSYLRMLLPAFLLAVGIEIGFLIIPLSPFAIEFSPASYLIPIWLVGFTFLTWLWMFYVRALSQLVLGTAIKRPKFTRYLVSVGQILLLWMLYVPAFFSRLAILVAGLPSFSEFFPQAIDGSEYLLMMFGFTTLVLIAGAGFFFFWFICSLFVIGIYLLLGRTPKCSECGKETSHIFVVGKKCEHCHHELATWIYTEANADGFCS